LRNRGAGSSARQIAPGSRTGEKESFSLGEMGGAVANISLSLAKGQSKKRNILEKKEEGRSSIREKDPSLGKCVATTGF